MPTYGYKCPACGDEFEVWQRMTDEAAADCPNCGSAAKRLFYPAGIVFRGTGFYKTDSRSSDTGSSAPPSKSSPPSTGGSDSGSAASGGKADATPAPAPKTDAKPAKSSGSSDSKSK